MSRALLTLLVGIVLAVLLAAGIAGDRALLPILGPVLVTTGIGAGVLAVVARRARLKERAERLQDDGSMPATAPDDSMPATAPDDNSMEADRG